MKQLIITFYVYLIIEDAFSYFICKKQLFIYIGRVVSEHSIPSNAWCQICIAVAYFDIKLTLIVIQDSSYLLLVLTFTFRSKILEVSAGYEPR